ncbi:hypothetical protein MYSTI_02801 [Myxococcus stipitatus DSM 14675]|uniref:Uncharacterized protein n=1 Tax=Myxococcus stipitatus (strain DSM 14675 / JCM 12634 / Mx s8) TaxID=1278073 RepID=L7U963_MYXSD|nr:hypothetical protein MYSTI_02801 [Myxococcus stipitatus DSM 14675]
MATNPSTFDKDFGYLMPFLDKVAAAAASLEDASAREELIRLMAEEKGRWARAQELLRGASGASVQGPQAPPEPRVDQTPSARAGLTVGSLRGVAPVKSRRR